MNLGESTTVEGVFPAVEVAALLTVYHAPEVRVEAGGVDLTQLVQGQDMVPGFVWISVDSTRLVWIRLDLCGFACLGRPPQQSPHSLPKVTCLHV